MGDFDEDMPAGFRDADLETAALEQMGREESARRKRGECSHSWTGPQGDVFACYHCGFVWPTRAAVDQHWTKCRLGDCRC